jgi:hypothetical protein
MGLFGQPRGVRIMQADERKAARLSLLPSRVTAGPGRKAGLALIRDRAHYPARPQRSRQAERPRITTLPEPITTTCRQRLWLQMQPLIQASVPSSVFYYCWRF